MPLNITGFHQTAVAILNRWARERENDHNSLRREVETLKQQIQLLKK